MTSKLEKFQAIAVIPVNMDQAATSYAEAARHLLGYARIIVAWKRGTILNQPILNLIATISSC